MLLRKWKIVNGKWKIVNGKWKIAFTRYFW